MSLRAALFLPVLALLCGCGRYADFALPAPEGSAAAEPAFQWRARTGAVLERGAAGEWDSIDALNPSVVEFGGKLVNLYSGYDGKTWHTGVAESPDGVTWRKAGRVISPDGATWEGNYIAANGSAMVVDGSIVYWYQAGDPPRIGVARSNDGRAWRKEQAPVLRLGPRGSWDERGVADPYVIRRDGRFYLFYLGQDRAHQQRLGIARSADGVTWEKLRSNPILELGAESDFDENGLGEPAVWTSHGRWWMLYTGRDRREYRRIGLAWSKDGVQWQRYRTAPLFTGGEAWNAKVVCDPALLPGSGGALRMWYGGGDVAHPAENIHGAIGYAELSYSPDSEIKR
ncbi:MAG: hypothetical protein U0Q16_35520 [Bryobacteraceae bacterium]